jgi:uncharacterized membrane protein YfcA
MEVISTINSYLGPHVSVVYWTIVIMGGLYGACSAQKSFYKFSRDWTPVKLKIEMLDDIVNACLFAGIWGMYTLMGFLGSSFITGTSPISVPILLYLFKDKDKEK